MDGLLTWTDCDEAGDYVVPYVLSPRDLVFRPDNMNETVSHTPSCRKVLASMYVSRSGTKVLFICSKTGITVHHFLRVPEQESQTTRKKAQF